jgi:glycosylphosphatidylinositol phospholipase D
VFWHGLGGFQESFINAMAMQNFHGDTAEAHTAADAGAEFTLRHSAELQYFNSTWTVPARDLANIYRRMHTKLDDTAPSEADIGYCMRVGYVAFKADLKMGKYLFPHYGQQSPFLIENLNHYHRGGMQDMSLRVAKCWKEFAMTFEDETNTGTMCSPHWDSSRMTSTRSHQKSATSQSYEQALLLLGQSGYKIIETWEGSSGVVTLSLTQSQRKITPEQHVFQQYETLGQDLQSEECQILDADMILTMGHTSGSLGFDVVLGDFNDDGFPDIAVSDPYYSKVDLHAGIVLIIDGRKHTHQLDDHNVFRASTLQLYNNIQESRFGWSMVVLDFNNDGIDDLAVSSPFQHQEQGSVNVYYGHAGSGLSSEPDVVLQLPRQKGASGFGTRLFALDVDGDGQMDLVVGCPYCGLRQAAQTGALMVFLSLNNPPKYISTPSFTIRSPIIQRHEHFGSSASIIEGSNNKKLLLVGSFGYSWSEAQRVGRVYAFNVDSKLKTRLQWTMDGDSEFQQFGSEIITGGDNVVISSQSDDTSDLCRTNRWQAGSIGIYRASELVNQYGQINGNSGLSERLYGKEMAGHFGSSTALDKEQLWIGEPLAKQGKHQLHL